MEEILREEGALCTDDDERWVKIPLGHAPFTVQNFSSCIDSASDKSLELRASTRQNESQGWLLSYRTHFF